MLIAWLLDCLTASLRDCLIAWSHWYLEPQIEIRDSARRNARSAWIQNLVFLMISCKTLLFHGSLKVLVLWEGPQGNAGTAPGPPEEPQVPQGFHNHSEWTLGGPFRVVWEAPCKGGRLLNKTFSRGTSIKNCFCGTVIFADFLFSKIAVLTMRFVVFFGNRKYWKLQFYLHERLIFWMFAYSNQNLSFFLIFRKTLFFLCF